MKQTLEEAVNEIGGVHPDWDKITCFRIGFKEGARWQTKQLPWVSVKERLPDENGDIIFTKATGMMFLRNRIKFFRPDGTRGDSPGCGSVLIAFGRENAEILRNCSLQGKYVELNNDK